LWEYTPNLEILHVICILEGVGVSHHPRVVFHTAMNTRTLKLFCWILGDSDSPFPVEIEDGGSVGDLKKAIVKENPHMFASVDARQLIVWKVSGSLFFTFNVLPADLTGKLDEAQPADFVQDFLARLLLQPTDLGKCAKKLNALRQLSNVFREDEPKEEHLHVVVERPVTG
jgi:hypothetical protein